MSEIIKTQIQQLLQEIAVKPFGKDIVTAGLVESVNVKPDRIAVVLQRGDMPLKSMERIRKQCEKNLRKAYQEIEYINVMITENKESADPSPVFAGAKYIIPVISGKGGVGKSTVTALLAKAFAGKGYRVGIVDVDVYGPSIPHMFGLNAKPSINEANKMIPLQAGDIQTMSIGYLVDSDKAAIWRGPMLTKAVLQLFFSTAWEEIDYLFVDMPPGTGDIPLTLAKQLPLSGAVVVSTPQELALIDAKKAHAMLEKLGIATLGVVENMSYVEVEGGKHYLFGKGGVERWCGAAQLPLLGRLPLDTALQAAADQGQMHQHLVNPLTGCIEGIINQLASS